MRLFIQRVSTAHVEVDRKVIGSIGPGILAFVGCTHNDTIEEARWLAQKLVHMRLFADEAGKLNRSLLEEKRSVLIVSQFTLYGECQSSRRPSFTQAAPFTLAQELYQHFIEEVRKTGVSVETGEFGADMQVSLVNDGPVTLLLEK